MPLAFSMFSLWDYVVLAAMLGLGGLVGWLASWTRTRKGEAP